MNFRKNFHIDQEIQEWKKRDRREALARKAALWGNRGKKAIALSVVDEEWNPALDNAGAAALLSEQWGRTFEARQVFQESMERLEPFIQRAPDDIEWIVSREEFGRLAARMRDTSPGPDGLPYSAWGKAGEQMIDAVYEPYVSLMRGAALPHGFNQSGL